MFMNKITFWAEKIALYSAIQRNIDVSSLEFVSIKFGWQILLIELTKFIPYGIIFALLGRLPEYLFALAVLAPLRVIGGGYHAKTYGGCNVSSFLIIFVGIYLGDFFAIGIELMAILFILGLLLTIFFAPVAHPNMPIKDDAIRKKRKFRSIVLFALWGIATVFFNQHFANITIFMLLAQALLLPIGLVSNKISLRKSNTCPSAKRCNVSEEAGAI